MRAARLLEPILPTGARLGVFSAIDGELDPAPLLAELRPDLSLCFPVADPATRSLRFFPGPAVRPGAFGVLEPVQDGEVPPTSLDALLVPALAFSTDGDRLGFGAGFYDRFLPLLPVHVPRIGVCYDWQIQPRLPREPHDACVSHLVTDLRLIAVAKH